MDVLSDEFTNVLRTRLALNQGSFLRNDEHGRMVTGYFQRLIDHPTMRVRNLVHAELLRPGRQLHGGRQQAVQQLPGDRVL